MNVLFLTTTVQPVNGYAVVGYHVCRGLLEHANCNIDVRTASEKRRLWPNKDSLKSTYVERLGRLAVLYDLVSLLITTRGQRYDLIHCNAEHFAWVAMLLSRLWRVPFTITAHGTYGVVLPCRFRAYRSAFEAAARVICVSAYTERRMREEGVRMKSCVVLNGVDSQIFRPANQLSKFNKIIFVGNFKRRKGFPFLLSAVKRARERGANFRLVVVGKVGEIPPDLANQITKAGIDVEFTGPVEASRLVYEYQTAKLNVLPSISEPHYFEGFGLIHLEANACGTLTVGTRESGNAEAVLPGNGYLVDQGDTEALAEVIVRTMALKDSRDLLPAQPLWRDWSQVAYEYAKVFDEVVKDTL